jgi:gliding motility-associated-like protein
VNRPLYILRLVLVVLLPLLMALAPAKAQTVVYQGKIFPLSVVQKPGNTYEWEIYSDVAVDFAKVPGNCPVTSATFLGGNTGASVDVQWLKTGIYFFKVTAHDANNCATNFKIGMIKVISVTLEGVIEGATFTGACQHVLLDASKSVGDIVKYEWSPVDKGGEFTRQSGVTTEFLLSPSYTGPLPADFRVRLLVTDRLGNTYSDTAKIKVDSKPVADVFSTNVVTKDGNMVVDGTVSIGSIAKYKWSTSQGKVIGADNQPTAVLSGAGVYLLEVTDTHGCTSTKSFTFPLAINQVLARPDYVRTSWAKDTTINVLRNDTSNVKLVPGSVHVVESPTRGSTKVNTTDGSITYMPNDRRPGRDVFTYEVCNEAKQCGSATVTVDIYDGGITAAEGFSPNGDGINDLLVFKELENYPNSSLYVYTRAGQLIYQSANYQNDWDGRSMRSTVESKELIPAGTYYYVLKLGGTNRSLKGFIYVGY